MRFILACDIGGTRTKAALVNETGRIAFLTSAASPEAVGAHGVREIEPDAWWAEFQRLVEGLADRASPEFREVDAVAITGVTRTQICIDGEGQPLRPAFLWNDARAADLIPAIEARSPAAHPETPFLNAFHPLSRLFWMARHEPQIARSTAFVVEPKDYLNLRLTGVAASDPVSMARIAASKTAGDDGRSLFNALAIDARMIPPLQKPASAIGKVSAGLPGALARLAGADVVMTGNDTWTAALGLGALRPGFAYNISGTTEALGLIADRPASAEGLLTVDWGDGLTQIGGPSQTGADALHWLNSNTRDGSASDDDNATHTSLIFLPFLQGERVPYWDADLRAAFLGLRREHGAADLRRAVMEGIAFLNRVVLRRAEVAAGREALEVRLGGGGATPDWAQIKADILARPIVTCSCEEPGLLGAALAASVALGCQPSLSAAQDGMVHAAKRYSPNPARRDHYDRLGAIFEDAHAAVAPLSRRLAHWDSSVLDA